MQEKASDRPLIMTIMTLAFVTSGYLFYLAMKPQVLKKILLVQNAIVCLLSPCILSLSELDAYESESW